MSSGSRQQPAVAISVVQSSSAKSGLFRLDPHHSRSDHEPAAPINQDDASASGDQPKAQVICLVDQHRGRQAYHPPTLMTKDKPDFRVTVCISGWLPQKINSLPFCPGALGHASHGASHDTIPWAYNFLPPAQQYPSSTCERATYIHRLEQ